MSTAADIYRKMIDAYSLSNDALVLECAGMLEGKRLAKSKRIDVNWMTEQTLRILNQEAIRREYHNCTFNARVDWFDNVRGEGMVTLSNNSRLPLYACNIRGAKTWYPETACVSYSKGQEVEIRTLQMSNSLFAIGLTPGQLDSEGWDRIKDKNLAFRCDDEGNAITGLFA